MSWKYYNIKPIVLKIVNLCDLYTNYKYELAEKWSNFQKLGSNLSLNVGQFYLVLSKLGYFKKLIKLK